jgi:hypothetical protein
LFCAAVLTGSLILAWQPTDFVYSHLLQDDSFYYLQIAKNIATGHGSTFDRINPTNGYHPLWTLLLVPVFVAVPNDTELALHLALTLQALLIAAAMVLLFRLLRNHLDRKAAFLPFLLWINPRFFLFWLNGMPSILYTVLHLCILLLVLSRCPLNKCELRPGWDYMLGVLLGLSFLSRLDAVFLILAVIVSILFSTAFPGQEGLSWKGALRRLIRMGIPIGLISLPYLAYNWMKFDHLVPISGSIKIIPFDFGSLGFYRDALLRAFWPLLFGGTLLSKVFREISITSLLACSVVVVGLLWFLIRTGWLRYVERLRWLKGMGFYFLFTLFHYLYNAIFIPKSIIYSWYWVPEVLSVLILAAALFSITEQWLVKQGRHLGTLFTITAYGFCLFLCVAVLAMRWNHPRHLFLNEIHKQAVWMRENLPEDAIVAAWDAGALGYFSELRVINIDGLVNNFEFKAYKEQGRLKEYLDEKGCQYIAQFFFDREDDMGKELESIRDRLAERLYRKSAILQDRFGYVPSVEDEKHEAIINVWKYQKPREAMDRRSPQLP